jgi:DNA-binding MarR family transcriptional regulator
VVDTKSRLDTATERPGIDDATIATVETELAILTRTLEELSRRSAIHQELDRASYLLARTLAAGGAASIGVLAARLGLDATTVTRQVANMHSGGLVHRRGDPHDGRVSVIELSVLGSRRMNGVRTARQARVARLLQDWPEKDRRALGSLLARFNAAIRANG